MKRFVLAVLMVLFAVPVMAQTGTPVQYVLSIYAAGGATPNAVTIPASAVTCGQAKPTGASDNPDTWAWDDPANKSLACIYKGDSARLDALADGNYEGTVRAINAKNESGPESARVPFSRTRPNPPAVISGVRVIR